MSKLLGLENLFNIKDYITSIAARKLDKSEDVVDNCTSTYTDKALSANQGKVLQDEISDLSSNPILLWENPNKTSSFYSSTKINGSSVGSKFNFNCSDYRFFIVICSAYITEPHTGRALLIRYESTNNDYSTITGSNAYHSGTLVVCSRVFHSYSDGFLIGHGALVHGEDTWTENDSACIPYYIYGVK